MACSWRDSTLNSPAPCSLSVTMRLKVSRSILFLLFPFGTFPSILRTGQTFNLNFLLCAGSCSAFGLKSQSPLQSVSKSQNY